MTIHKSKTFFWLSLSFLFGVIVRSFVSVNISLLWLPTVICLIIILLNYRNGLILLLAGVFPAFFFGVWRADYSLRHFQKIPEIQELISSRATVVKNLSSNKYNQKIIASVKKDNFLKAVKKENERFGISDNFFRKNIHLLLIVPLHDKLSPGDKFMLQCSPKIIRNKKIVENFNYKMYLAKEGVSYICQKPIIADKNTSQTNSLLKPIIILREKMIQKLSLNLPFPESTLAEGLLFGGSKQLPPKLKDAFSETGMTHIVAVSGYNVTIIATYLMAFGILLGLWRKQAFYLASLGIFIFISMIGFPGSAVRAGIMGILILWAIKNSRLANADNALLLAGNIMLLINPLLLRWDIGFQLSFLATLGIIKTSPLWQKYLLSSAWTAFLKETFFMTVSAQLFVLPIILYNFHSISLISIPANLLILPIIPLTMLFVLLTAFFGLLFAPISMMFSWLAYWLLFYEIKVIEILSKFPLANLTFGDISKNFPFLWYSALFLIITLMLKYEQIKKIFYKKDTTPS